MSDAKTTVAVVGGGYFGTTIACHLAIGGVPTMLLDRGELAGGASGANFGNIQVQDCEPGVSLELTLQSFALWQDMERQLDASLDYRPRPSLRAATTKTQWERLQAAQALKASQGLKGVQLLQGEDIARVEPWLCRDHITGVSWYLEGSITPFKVVRALARKAVACGALVREGVEVHGLLTKGGAVSGVATSAGEVEAEVVVLAAGAGTRVLGATAGVDIPVDYVLAEALATEVLPPTINCAFSLSGFFEEAHGAGGYHTSLCYTQTAAGNIVIGETTRAPEPGDGDEAIGVSSLEHLQGVARAVRKFLPGLAGTRVIRSWRTRSPFNPLHRPAFGFCGPPGLFVAAGFKSAAIMVPLAGRAAADLIMTGKTEYDLEGFSIL